ncbi:hypothetical protein Hanom_Chr10g00886431 [Helianthus anomalus]
MACSLVYPNYKSLATTKSTNITIITYFHIPILRYELPPSKHSNSRLEDDYAFIKNLSQTPLYC